MLNPLRLICMNIFFFNFEPFNDNSTSTTNLVMYYLYLHILNLKLEIQEFVYFKSNFKILENLFIFYIFNTQLNYIT